MTHLPHRCIRPPSFIWLVMVVILASLTLTRIRCTHAQIPQTMVITDWTTPLKFLESAMMQTCQPRTLVNDINDLATFYVGCALPQSQGPIIQRYSLLTNTTQPMINQSQTVDQSVSSMKQDSSGRLWFISNSPVMAYSIGYVLAPLTADVDTNAVFIPRFTFPNFPPAYWDVFDVATKGDIAYISLLVDAVGNSPTLIRVNLTSFNYTIVFTVSYCAVSFVDYDATLDAFLVACDSKGIVAIPAGAPDSPYVLIEQRGTFQPIDFRRVKSSDLILYFTDGSSFGLLIWSNITSPKIIMSFDPKSCPSIQSWAYSSSRDTLLITCSATAASTGNLITIQPTKGELSVANDADGLSIEVTILATLCTSRTLGPYGALFDPYTSSGVLGLCGDSGYLVRGHGMTTLVTTPTCVSIDWIQTDEKTGMVFAHCDGYLLVLDGPSQALYAVANGQEIDFLFHSSLTGQTIIVSDTGSADYNTTLVVWLVEPITHEMVMSRTPLVSTSIFNFTISTADEPQAFLAYDLLILSIEDTVMYFNFTLGALVSLPPLPFACDSGLSGLGMNGYLFLTCYFEAVTVVRLDLTQPSNGWTTIYSLPWGWIGIGRMSARVITNQLYLTGINEDGGVIIVIINSTMTTNSTANVIAFPIIGQHMYDVFVDQTSSLIFMAVPHFTSAQQLVSYDERSEAITKLQLANTDCDNLQQLTINSNTGVVYLTCLNGNLLALSKDFTCQEGYQWTRQQQCQQCAIGSARGMLGANQTYIPQCQLCQPGTIAIQPGSAVCEPCPLGRFQDVSEEQREVCSFCQPGKYQNDTGQTFCYSCPPGEYTVDVGYSSCAACQPGRFSASNTSSTCDLCSRGTASNTTGLSQPCPICPSGSEQLLYGGTTCSPCQLGSYASSGDPCTVCAKNTYQPVVGAKCQPCDGPNQIGLECESGLATVNPGYFAYQIYDSTQQLWIYVTTKCPPNYCPGSPLQSPFNSTTMNGTAESIQYCTSPRLNSPENLLCAECEDGYLVWGQECVSCNSTNPGLLLAIVLFLFVLVLFLLRSSTESAGHLTILLYFIQISALELQQPIDNTTDNTSSINWLQIFNLSILSFNTCFAPLTPSQQILLTYASPFILFLVLIIIGLVHRLLERLHLCRGTIGKFSFNRYISCSMTILLFCYTNVTVVAVKTLNCVSIAPNVTVLWSHPTIDCSSNEYHHIFIITVCCLVIYIVGFPLAILAFLLRRHYSNRSIRATPIPIPTQSLEFHSDNNDLSEPFSPTDLISEPNSSDLTNESNSRSLMEMTIGSQSADGRMILSEFDLRWGALYLTFTPKSWYWQPWVLVRRFGFALVSVLIDSPHLTFSLFIGLNIFSAYVHLIRQPFRSPILNRLDIYAHTLLIIISLILNGLGSSRPFGIQLLLLGLIIPPAIAFGLFTLKHHLTRLRSNKKGRDDISTGAPAASLVASELIVGDLTLDSSGRILHSRSTVMETI